jgi:TRAP-type mannitol/chloroaromatic compound transport system permease large subunit
MILSAVAAEQSLGRLFLAGLLPGVLLNSMFALYAVLRYRKEYRDALHQECRPCLVDLLTFGGRAEIAQIANTNHQRVSPLRCRKCGVPRVSQAQKFRPKPEHAGPPTFQ